MLPTGRQDVSNILNSLDGSRQFERLLKSSQRLGRALLVYPPAISGIDIEHFRRNRRNPPSVPSRECALDLRLSLL